MPSPFFIPLHRLLLGVASCCLLATNRGPIGGEVLQCEGLQLPQTQTLHSTVCTEDTRFSCLSCPSVGPLTLHLALRQTVTDSSMTDLEMSSVWKFVAETNLDEIFFNGPVAMDIASDVANTLVSFHPGGPANETAVVIKTEPIAVSDTSSEVSYDDKTSVASFNSDETSGDEDIKPLVGPATTTEIKRLKQKAYDKRYRDKKKITKLLLASEFVAALKLLKALLEDRVQRTRMVIMTMRLVSLEQDTQPIAACERDRKTIEKEVKEQLALNKTATGYAESWTTTWTRVKVKQGKYFLKANVVDINVHIQGLATLHEKLTEATTELEWCMQQNCSGVWI